MSSCVRLSATHRHEPFQPKPASLGHFELYRHSLLHENDFPFSCGSFDICIILLKIQRTWINLPVFLWSNSRKKVQMRSRQTSCGEITDKTRFLNDILRHNFQVATAKNNHYNNNNKNENLFNDISPFSSKHLKKDVNNRFEWNEQQKAFYIFIAFDFVLLSPDLEWRMCIRICGCCVHYACLHMFTHEILCSNIFSWLDSIIFLFFRLEVTIITIIIEKRWAQPTDDEHDDDDVVCVLMQKTKQKTMKCQK